MIDFLKKIAQSFKASSTYAPDTQPLISPVLKKKSMIPVHDRSSDSLNGSEFGKKISRLPADQNRDDEFVREISAGNVPDFMRNFSTVTVLDRGNMLQYYVSGDYVSVGSNDDYLRACVNGKTAKKIANLFDCMLPTKRISDDIWRMADLRLIPHPMGSSKNMISTETLINHNVEIEKQINGRAFGIIAGIKKDIVICKNLLKDRSKIAIYGWHSLSGIAIQGQNSTSHDVWYQDYSQAVRLVSRSAFLNNQPIDLVELLKDPKYAYLISEEGAYDSSSIY